jgi:EAL domain-containing protein (putative c-di-GMP-specific phosphodiesterase class I)
MPGRRVVLELTEHSHVADHGALIEALAPLRAASVRVAVDDAGAGLASMRHVLRLPTDLIKLDASLIRGIEDEPSKRALPSAMVVIARGRIASSSLRALEPPPNWPCCSLWTSK